MFTNFAMMLMIAMVAVSTVCGVASLMNNRA